LTQSPAWATTAEPFALIGYSAWLVAMGVLLFCSGFFSAAEAALFYLNRQERRRLASGNRAQRVAARLLDEPDRLLTAVLFWNLLVNITYFTISSITSISLKAEGHATLAGAFAAGSLLVIIVLSEMLPKSLAVLQPRAVATLVGVPLSAAVRAVDPILPVLRAVNLLSRRLLWPSFEPEPYLHVRDLERAVELSTSNAALLNQEQTVLQRIVTFSEMRADELMRPRTRFLSFHPPVALADLGGRLPPSGYLLVTEPESDEVAGAVPLKRLWQVPAEHLEEQAEPVAYVPWCTTLAGALETMQRDNRRVAAVVNEFGETIGILTLDDVLDEIFSAATSRSQRLLRRVSIRRVAPGVWHVTGMTSLWRLVRHFRVSRPASKSVTVAGVLQETLGRLPNAGDECRWGPFRFKVLDVSQRGQLLVELTRVDPHEETAP
jgi:putative hemolysin